MPRERRGVNPLRIPLYDPFAHPVPTPTADPGDATLLCLKINEQYRKYLIGALWRLCYPDAWQGTAGVQETAVKRIHELIAIISEASTCDELIFDSGGGHPLAIGDIIWTIAPCNQYRLEMGSGPHLAADWPELTPFLIQVGWMAAQDTEFTLPDITDVYLSMDTNQIGTFAGENSRDLTVDELPNHAHFHSMDHANVWIGKEIPFTLDPPATGTPYLIDWELQADGGNISGRDLVGNNPAITPMDVRSKRLYLRACIVAATPPPGATAMPDDCCDQPPKPGTIEIINIWNTENNTYNTYNPNDPTTVDPGLIFDGLPSESTFANEDALCFALSLFFEGWRREYNSRVTEVKNGSDPSLWDIALIAVNIAEVGYSIGVAIGKITFNAYIVAGLGGAHAIIEILQEVFDNDDVDQLETLPEDWTTDITCFVWNNLRGQPITRSAWGDAFTIQGAENTIGGLIANYVWLHARKLAKHWDTDAMYYSFLKWVAEVRKVLPPGGYDCPCCRITASTPAQVEVTYTPGTHPQNFIEDFDDATLPPNPYYVYRVGELHFRLDQPELVTKVHIQYVHSVGESFTVWDMHHEMACYQSNYVFQGPNETDAVFNPGSIEAQDLLIRRDNGNKFNIRFIKITSEPVP